MRILFVDTATSMSIGDVARGYKRALERQGHEIATYGLSSRLAAFNKIAPENAADRANWISRLASETILNEAMYHGADVVLIISGLNVHPIALWLLGKVGIPAAVIFTESPYDDEPQSQWIDLNLVNSEADIQVFTNDLFSARKYGWTFLAPSFDPAFHHPVEPVPEFECDVVIVGTGWPERQKLLEAVDWTGIDLRLYGIWPGLNENPDSPLAGFYRPSVVSNSTVPSIYCSAKVNVNIHRASSTALTPGPRVFELAGCGAFQISDPREGLSIFRGHIPTFRTPAELGILIRYYLDRPEERTVHAAAALDASVDEDFDNRAGILVSALESRLQEKRRVQC